MSRFTRVPSASRVTLPALALALAAGLGLVAAPATATTTTLCKGYDACERAGMSHAGYKGAAGTMWWRMYTGHNCTNYAAYRVVKNGFPNVRPWSGGGNATYWGTSNAAITDSTPRVGAVAWWKANVRPAGSAGHVAYVEEVVSADEIIVSQDSWGGDFSWARITRSGGGWPSGFVHFNDVPLENTLAPVVSGPARVGQRLTTTPGVWSEEDVTLTYQWRAAGRDVAGATASTLKLTRKLKGKQVSVAVTAGKLGFPSATAESALTAAVMPGRLRATTAPTVTGDPVVDGLLTATPGTWSPAAQGVSYQWTADGEPVDGATGETFSPGPDQVGRALAVQVTATRAQYQPVVAATAATAPVVPGTLAVSGRPAVTGRARLGEPLAVALPEVAPADVDVSVTWLRAGRRVPGAPDATEYVPTAEGLGSRIAARVTLSRPGYTDLVLGARRSRPVREVATLDLTATPGRSRVRLVGRVGGEHAGPADGTALVRSRGETLAEVPVAAGRFRTVLLDLEPGTVPLRVVFTGSRTLTRAKAVERVEVR